MSAEAVLLLRSKLASAVTNALFERGLEKGAPDVFHAIWPLVEAALTSARIESRRDAADAVSELRDEILAKFDDSTTQQALKAIANDWLSQARRAARGAA